ncbi:MAG: hypothetical protein AAFW66_09315 [Pseudomonadota bacterium]
MIENMRFYLKFAAQLLGQAIVFKGYMTDLQSVSFNHSDTPPIEQCRNLTDHIPVKKHFANQRSQSLGGLCRHAAIVSTLKKAS